MENVQFVQFDDNASPRSSPRPKPRPIPTPSEAIRLPGYGLPLNYLPPRKERFPVLMGDRNKDWKATTLLIREVCMLKFMEDITNKPEWWRKVCDPNIAARWKQEVLSLNWAEYRKHGDFTKNMAEMCIQELRKKAALYEETSLIPVMDHSTCVIKSDKLVSEDLTERLKTAVKSLEHVADSDKDWHPGSDGKVLDLVHPSLFPLLYGRSRIMRHQRIGLDECLNFCGRGFLLEKPGDDSESQLEATIDWRRAPIEVVSPRFQWLPCDVAIDEDGRATIESYINNLHPKDHAAMYPIIEEFIQKSLPAWDLIYRWVKKFPVQRLTARKVGRGVSRPDVVPEEAAKQSEDDNDGEEHQNRELDGDTLGQLCSEETEGEKRKYYTSDGENSDESENPDDVDSEGEDYDDDDDDDDDEYDNSDIEEDDINKASPYFRISKKHVRSSGFFNRTPRIQVIVKLANIHLTPDKPSYDGGSWHIEGQLNEHICATALFYYDCHNITESRLAFRTPANVENLGQRLKYQQNDRASIERVFAIRSGFDTLQDVGSVLTRPGRSLFFSNLCQHRVQPFKLEDPTKPGHRKILALFLVDPAIPVISTSNVPPQQRHWYTSGGQSEAVATVLQNMDSIMVLDEAKKLREELMAERTVLQQNVEDELNQVEWSFCEH
ncbi:uncharacterized protein G6M90_00g020900 [Metarhizium brunneum]|uniref:Duf1665 domain containing protein n=1 Tax=Metarhizium brunneum TaxID=500148 RepID=A0A7D5Z413_9HYPO